MFQETEACRPPFPTSPRFAKGHRGASFGLIGLLQCAVYELAPSFSPVPVANDVSVGAEPHICRVALFSPLPPLFLPFKNA